MLKMKSVFAGMWEGRHENQHVIIEDVSKLFCLKQKKMRSVMWSSSYWRWHRAAAVVSV